MKLKTVSAERRYTISIVTKTKLGVHCSLLSHESSSPEMSKRVKRTWFRGCVGDVTGPVLLVLEVDLGFARSLDSDGEAAGARLARVDVELGLLVDLAALEPGSDGAHLVGAAVRDGSDCELERATCARE